MTNNEFILWLKGFTEGVHEYNITPKQWDLLKERLSEVDDENRTQKVWGGETTGFIQPVHTTLLTPASLTITSGSHGTVHNVPAVTTSGYIAPVNQEIPKTIITTGSSSTAVMYTFTGTTITYTTSGGPNWYATYFNDLKTDDNDR